MQKKKREKWVFAKIVVYNGDNRLNKQMFKVTWRQWKTADEPHTTSSTVFRIVLNRKVLFKVQRFFFSVSKWTREWQQRTWQRRMSSSLLLIPNGLSEVLGLLSSANWAYWILNRLEPEEFFWSRFAATTSRFLHTNQLLSFSLTWPCVLTRQFQ